MNDARVLSSAAVQHAANHNMWGVLSILLAGAGAAGLASLVAGWLSHKVKLSEFRQAWINDLRADVAEFIGITHQWVQVYDRISAAETSDERKTLNDKKLSKINTEAIVVLSRIEMRINPRNNEYKKDDDAFLQALRNLLNPQSFPTVTPDSSKLTTFEAAWALCAEEAVWQAQCLLKREWEVVKSGILNNLCKKLRGCVSR